MSEPSTLPHISLSAWKEWWEKCTIQHCSPDTIGELAVFAKSRLYGPLNKLNRNLAQEYCGADAAQQNAWLQMEAHLYSGRNQSLTKRDGKTYKDFAFAQSKTPEEMEKYLTKVFDFSIARKIVACEGPGLRNWKGEVPKGVIVISKDAPQGDSSQSLGDSLAEKKNTRNPHESEDDQINDWTAEQSRPDPASVADPFGNDERSEDESVFAEPETDGDNDAIVHQSQALAQPLWLTWDERKKIIFVFLAFGFRAADVHRSKLIDCSQSQLYVATQSVLDSLKEVKWNEKYEPNGWRHAYLTRALKQQLLILAKDWLAKSEPEKRERLLSFIMMDAHGSEGSLS